MRQNRQRWVRSLLALILVALFGGLPGAVTHAQTPIIYLYFPQTGHYVGGVFRTFWEQNGGVRIFGYPITEEYVRNSDGKLVQYFERARFELRVENNQPIIELGLLGREYLRIRGDIIQPIAPFPSTSTRRYFPETGHSVQGLFKSFWEGNNGLRLFGYPITEEMVERFPDGSQRVVQYFERTRFELIGNRVELGLLGRALAPCQLLAPLPPNAPPTRPVAEGDSSKCPPIIPVAFGRAYPEVSAPGTVLGFEARGYAPNETVALWLNLPDGTARALPYNAIAASDGGVLIGFRTLETDPVGQWSIVGRGITSGREVVALFQLRR